MLLLSDFDIQQSSSDFGAVHESQSIVFTLESTKTTTPAHRLYTKLPNIIFEKKVHLYTIYMSYIWLLARNEQNVLMENNMVGFILVAFMN